MLTLTENASSIVKAIAAQTPGADEGGLRISSAAEDNTDFAVAVTPAPEPQDQVVESDGAKVFLEENAAVALDDKVLDAQVDEKGAVRFAIGVAQ
ncbi:Fe-S cluster assembly protein HesB [Microbacterium sp. STN6]|uniref:Fe-S cluster assembly protein HesB n=1 Tax=Microbacterium sp. STN6 TaxID=2995588 RepID=UPI002260E803|nr:Fe-S cluster assembly protein HesB [Microbacterium sp. STN6]MCX7520658.1 Fe-S cluster assembly protein HesB [Microbacterium sp. STN6]